MIGPVARWCKSARKRLVSCSMIRMAKGSRLVAGLAVPSTCLPQVIDRIEVHARPVADGRIEVARHGQVEDEQGPFAARGLDLLELIAA